MTLKDLADKMRGFFQANPTPASFLLNQRAPNNATYGQNIQQGFSSLAKVPQAAYQGVVKPTLPLFKEYGQSIVNSANQIRQASPMYGPVQQIKQIVPAALNAGNIAYRLNPLTPLTGAGFGFLKGLRETKDVNKALVSAQRGVAEQPFVGEAITSNPTLATVLNFATIPIHGIIAKKFGAKEIKLNALPEEGRFTLKLPNNKVITGLTKEELSGWIKNLEERKVKYTVGMSETPGGMAFAQKPKVTQGRTSDIPTQASKGVKTLSPEAQKALDEYYAGGAGGNMLRNKQVKSVKEALEQRVYQPLPQAEISKPDIFSKKISLTSSISQRGIGGFTPEEMVARKQNFIGMVTEGKKQPTAIDDKISSIVANTPTYEEAVTKAKIQIKGWDNKYTREAIQSDLRRFFTSDFGKSFATSRTEQLVSSPLRTGGTSSVPPNYKVVEGGSVHKNIISHQAEDIVAAKGLAESPSLDTSIAPSVYHAEATAKTKAKIQTSQQRLTQMQHDKDLREWSQMMFKSEGATIKSKEEALIKTIGRNIEESTERATAARILNEKRQLKVAQSEARKVFATTQKGRVITSKGGSPLDREVVLKAQNWKDKPRLSYARETMERNFEDIMGADAPKMKAQYIEPVNTAEASRIRWLNKERSEIKSLGITPKSQESKLVQQLGEGLINKKQVLSQPNGEKIVNAEKVLRQKYDKYLNEINGVLRRNGYDPIPKRRDYFRHFTEVKGLLEQIGIPVRDNTLPTDINGLTADFKPGKNFFANALQRKTDITDYDAIGGIDGYIEGASKQIFHTDNIQNLRLLDKSIRETFAGTKHLSNFVADLTEYTNNLAGKKPMVDRAAEALLGRTIYGATDRLRKQVGANMVGANVASALTNYIPLTQALATTDKPSFAKGMLQTILSVFKDDGFTDRSGFLTRRIGSDRLSMSNWDKVGNKAMWLMRTIDNFTSGTIVRSKYFEGLKKGLSPSQAMKRADTWAGKIMAERSLGSMPTLFNSKTLGFLTQFQLEVNNQMSFMFKDIPRNYNTVGAASALGQLFLYGYIFNSLYEKAFGRRPAFDPIGVAQQSYEDYTNPNMKEGQATKNLSRNIADQLPFAGALTGGRFPIGAAIPDVGGLATGETTLGKELKKPLYYILPPTGGGQIKKGVEGLNAFTQGGSITDSGRVRYPIPQTPLNAVRTVVGGQYATPEARQYFREGRTPLGEKQSEAFKQSTNKEGLFNQIIGTLQQNAVINKIKKDAQQGKTQQQGNFVPIVKDDGSVDVIDLSFQPTPPSLTGLYELDKKAISKFNGQITQKANDIYALYNVGKITAVEAEKQLNDLKDLKISGGKKAKKITVPKLTTKKITISMPKKAVIKALKIPAPPKIKAAKTRKTKTFSVKPIKTPKLTGLRSGVTLV